MPKVPEFWIAVVQFLDVGAEFVKVVTMSREIEPPSFF